MLIFCSRYCSHLLWYSFKATSMSFEAHQTICENTWCSSKWMCRAAMVRVAWYLYKDPMEWYYSVGKWSQTVGAFVPFPVGSRHEVVLHQIRKCVEESVSSVPCRSVGAQEKCSFSIKYWSSFDIKSKGSTRVYIFARRQYRQLANFTIIWVERLSRQSFSSMLLQDWDFFYKQLTFRPRSLH